jgi:GTPase SAR1 family protein
MDEGKKSSGNSKTSDEIMDDDLPPADLKVILLGDSAVGKSKLVERFLMGDYHPRQLSTYGMFVSFIIVF